MNIQAIVKLLLEGGTLTDEQKTFASSWNPGEAIAAARKEEAEKSTTQLKAANDARLLAESTKDTLEKSLAELHEKDGTELERMAKKLERVESELESQKETGAKALRDASLLDVAGRIVWKDDKAASSGRVLINHHFKDVTDFGDKDTMIAMLDQFKEANPYLIRANGAGGGGADPGNPNESGLPSPTGRYTKASIKKLSEENPEEFDKQWPEINKAMLAGEITE